MHFTWQNGMVTFFLAVVAVTRGIMAFNGMQQHCMVQFINFNRLTIFHSSPLSPSEPEIERSGL